MLGIFYSPEGSTKTTIAPTGNLATFGAGSPIPPCFLPSSLGNHINTILECNEVIDQGLYPEQAYYNRGLAYLKLGKYDLALEDCLTSIELSPQDARGYYNCGISHYELGENELALEKFTTTIELAPNWMMGYYHRAMTFVELDRWEDAEDDNLYAWYLNRKHYKN